jgi:YesN/AraC family two-component response regulator
LKPNLLIVDDEPEIREAIGFFAQNDFQIHEAANGLEALKRISEFPIDIIISDYNMPKMDGLELLKLLNESDQCIPVIWLTGRGSSELCRSTWGLGVYDYLEKPFKSHDLLVCLTGGLNSKKALSEVRNSRLISKKLFEEPKILLGVQTFKQFQDICIAQGLSVSTMLTRLMEEQIKREKIG